ncbi:hypothetical protein Hypma_011881 [Hypsizygus marmoreus]|uniref:Uncharacterized protein n=1 Tax=Hypsizygus marmoreus TaxID=39966 RepID=A0A369JKR8_HYPMA|nr:hypothetical protein Hypma_011881 [Hypsizygus marmoreus]
MSVKVCGYLVNEEAVLQHGIQMGLGTDGDMYTRSDTMCDSFIDIMGRAGLLGHARWVGVMVKGELRRCIALGNNDPYDYLPMPSREKIDQLKKVLHIEKEPRWYIYA